MKAKRILRVLIDILMTITLLFQMTYELIGQSRHEWQGMWMFFLFIIHLGFNWPWIRAVFKGRYTAFRILQTVLAVSIFLCMMGSMVSGIVLSRHVFTFLEIRSGSYWARNVHMLCAYWGFTLMSIHLGLHWGMMLRGFGRMLKVKAPSRTRKVALRTFAVLIAGYGCYAITKRSLFEYMFFRTQFVFFDFGESLIFFLLDYLAMMGLFVFIGYYASQGTKRIMRKTVARNEKPLAAGIWGSQSKKKT